MATFSERLEQALRMRDMTAADLARKTGIGEGAISQYRKGAYKATQSNLEKIASALTVSIPWLMGATDVQIPQGLSPMPAVTAVPRLGTIACGEPILAEQNIDGYDQIPDYIKCDFTLVCKGDSMIDARIHDGDIVCIKQQDIVDNGQVAAVLIGEEATLKRFYYEDGTVTLMAANPSYPPKTFSGEAISNVRVLGLATHFISKVV